MRRSLGLSTALLLLLVVVTPVAAEPKALVLLLDKSGSMKEDGKLDAAKKAASDAIAELADEDYISIVAFDAAPFLVVPIQTVAEAKQVYPRRLNQLVAVGRTSVIAALGLAQRELAKLSVRKKHVLILSDGKLHEPVEFLSTEVRRLVADAVTVSTIASGTDNDGDTLRALAKLGGGSFYQSATAATYQKIFVNDVKTFIAK